MKTKCKGCENVLLDKKKKLTEETMYLYFKQYDVFDNSQKGLIYPSVSLFNCFCSFTYISDILLADRLYNERILCNLKREFSRQVSFQILSGCKSHETILKDELLSVSAKLCLKIHLRELNRSILEKNFDLKKFRDSLKEKAKCKVAH